MTVVDHQPETEQLAGFALLARLGKRVLRPGGAELTGKLLDELAIGHHDDVLEIASGRGGTATMILSHDPASYVAIDRDIGSEQAVAPLLNGSEQKFRRSSVSRTGLGDASRDVAIGEAILTMQPHATKEAIVAELARVVRPGGRLGLHEVAFHMDDVDNPGDATNGTDAEELRIVTELRSHFKVNFNALTLDEWTELLDEHGFDLRMVQQAPLRLLEPDRIIADEGFAGATRFAVNVLRDGDARRRIGRMRAAMKRNAEHLRAVALVADRRG